MIAGSSAGRRATSCWSLIGDRVRRRRRASTRLRAHAARRDPRPLRHPGHRLHRIPGPGAAGRRGPGHLSADHRDADACRNPSGARLLVLRRLVRLRHLRGRHGPLLGALARARISELRRDAPAGRRDADPRAGRDRRRLGLPVRRARRARTLAELRTLAGLVRPLRLAKAEGVAEVASVGGFVKQYRSSSIRAAAALRHPARKVRDAIRASNMDVGGRTVELAETEYVVRGRGYLKGIHDIEKMVAQERAAARRSCSGTWRASSSGPTSAAASPSWTATARSSSGIVAAALRRRTRSP